MKLNLQSAAFIFPGQGSQAVGMGKDLAAQYPIARHIFEEADSILGFSLSNLMWNGPKEGLDETEHTTRLICPYHRGVDDVHATDSR